MSFRISLKRRQEKQNGCHWSRANVFGGVIAVRIMFYNYQAFMKHRIFTKNTMFM